MIDEAITTVRHQLSAAKCHLLQEADPVGRKARALVRAIAGEPGVANWLRRLAGHEISVCAHSLRVGILTTAFLFATAPHRPPDPDTVRGAFLHDVGKLSIPVRTLLNPAALSVADAKTLAAHPERGAALLVGDGIWSPRVLDIVRHHHEALDGTGYPDRCVEADCLPDVWITAVVDIFTALVEPRAYRPALSTAAALDVMRTMPDRVSDRLLVQFEGLLT